jgi:hypothetical protein
MTGQGTSATTNIENPNCGGAHPRCGDFSEWSWNVGYYGVLIRVSTGSIKLAASLLAEDVSYNIFAGLSRTSVRQRG